MLNSKMVKEAHKMAKEIKREYPEVNYRFQYGLCLSYLLNKEEEKIVELEGTEKQIAWAKNIKKDMLATIEQLKDILSYSKNKSEIYGTCINAWENYIVTVKSSNTFIKMWKNINIDNDQIRTKCYKMINNMSYIGWNIDKKDINNDVQVLIDNEELLRNLWLNTFGNLCRIYERKTGIQLPGHIME